MQPSGSVDGSWSGDQQRKERQGGQARAEFESSSEAASLTFFFIQWLRRLTCKSSFSHVPSSDKSSCVAPFVPPSLLIQPSDLL